MPATKVNAENWTFQIGDDPEDLTVIKGVETFSDTENTTRADTADFDSEGVEENRVIRRGLTVTINGNWLEDEATGELDPGQALVVAATREVGTAAEKTIRVTSPGGAWEQYRATLSKSKDGDKNDVTKFSYEIVRTGASTFGVVDAS